MKSSRKSPRWVAVSGGFDPLHIGHVRMFQKARKLGGKLVVILNNDNWLRYKKGFAFMPEQERKEIIEAFPFVDKVVLTDHKPNTDDISICNELKKLKPAIFANGGDRKPEGDPVPEVELCKKLGIKIVYNVGHGGKVQSSSWMVKDAIKGALRSVRPWGEFTSYDEGTGWFLKTIRIQPGKRLSLQYHNHRSEYWMLVEGDATATIHTKEKKELKIKLKRFSVMEVPRKAVHRLESKGGCALVEVARGNFDEKDIVRLHDDHGRI
jgi:cytidyltransferase-like protein